MSDVVAAAVATLAEGWNKEAEARRRISKHDLVADVLDYCAAEIIEQLRTVTGPGAMRTVEQFAREYSVTPPTIRKWIAKGELEALLTPHGYRILHTAVRKRRRRRVSAARVDPPAPEPKGL